MTAQNRIDALLSQYEQLRDEGRPVSPSTLCEDDPELLGPITDRIAALDAGRRLLNKLSTLSGNGPTTSGNSQPFPTVAGYEILQLLGEGGMGVVYVARQLALDRLVALKTIPAGGATASAQVRMRLEAATIAKLSHPNVVQVYEVGEANGQTFFSLELMLGGALDARLVAGPLAPIAAAKLLVQLAAAMEATHRVGIIHCDLKPANVLLTADGTPKVADFGLARQFQDENRLTRTGTVRGTPSYMAPEQADGLLGEFGPPVDVYALGGILYELLTGRPPFLAATLLDTLAQVRSQEPVPPSRLNPSVPRDLETVCLKCLSKPPTRRYPTAAALGDDLQRFLEGRPILARRTGIPERIWRWCVRHPTRAALVCVCLVSGAAAVSGGVWMNWRLDRELTQVEHARDAAEKALVSQAAERLDGELRELASVPHLVALAIESGDAVRPEWLAQLMANDDRIHGICVALEPEAEVKFALLVQRWSDGVKLRRLDQEANGPVYWQRDWYTHGRENGRSWTDSYIGTDDRRTLMVSHVVPIRKAGRFRGVVVLDLAVHSLRSVENTLHDLIPGVDDTARLLTKDGHTLLEADGAPPAPPHPAIERTATIPSTGWRLVVSVRRTANAAFREPKP